MIMSQDSHVLSHWERSYHSLKSVAQPKTSTDLKTFRQLIHELYPAESCGIKLFNRH